jgi:hypothetical protein
LSRQNKTPRSSAATKREANTFRSLFSVFGRILYENFVDLRALRYNLTREKMAARNPYVVPALTKHTATVIMAHGLGDTYVSKTSTSDIETS